MGPKRKIVIIDNDAENGESTTAFTQRKRKVVTKNLDDQNEEGIIDLCGSNDSDNDGNSNDGKNTTVSSGDRIEQNRNNDKNTETKCRSKERLDRKLTNN